MIALGVLLILIGFLVKIAAMWTVGLVLLALGIGFLVWGLTGHRVGGRSHWY